MKKDAKREYSFGRNGTEYKSPCPESRSVQEGKGHLPICLLDKQLLMSMYHVLCLVLETFR